MSQPCPRGEPGAAQELLARQRLTHGRAHALGPHAPSAGAEAEAFRWQHQLGLVIILIVGCFPRDAEFSAGISV